MLVQIWCKYCLLFDIPTVCCAVNRLVSCLNFTAINFNICLLFIIITFATVDISLFNANPDTCIWH